MTRIYLAGPMSGLPEFNYPAFNAEAARLRSLGHEVENPAENTPPPCGTYQGYMRNALRRMLTCDVIATLPGYRESRGAMIETQLAARLSIPVMPASDFITGVKREAGEIGAVKIYTADIEARALVMAGMDAIRPDQQLCGPQPGDTTWRG